MGSNESVVILVVEDDEAIRTMAKALLEISLRIPILTFTNGLDAKEYIQENHVDLVISDVDMPINGKPAMSGIELLEWVKKERSNIIVFITTGEPSHKRKADELGADYFFHKPYKVPELVSAIKKYVSFG